MLSSATLTSATVTSRVQRRLVRPRSQRQAAVVDATRQGSYSREDAAKKRTHADQARAAFWRVQSSALAGACESTCTLGCENRVTRDELFGCLEASYGMISWI